MRFATRLITNGSIFLCLLSSMVGLSSANHTEIVEARKVILKGETRNLRELNQLLALLSAAPEGTDCLIASCLEHFESLPTAFYVITKEKYPQYKEKLFRAALNMNNEWLQLYFFYDPELVDFALENFDVLSIFANNQMHQVLYPLAKNYDRMSPEIHPILAEWALPRYTMLKEKSLKKYGPVTEQDLEAMPANADESDNGFGSKPVCLLTV